MAKQKGKKASSGSTNSDRKNGKAFKKNRHKPAPPKTDARILRDIQILGERARRREEGMARHAEEQARKAEALERLAADRLAEAAAKEEERQARWDMQQIADQEAIDSEKAEQARIAALPKSMQWMRARQGGKTLLSREEELKLRTQLDYSVASLTTYVQLMEEIVARTAGKPGLKRNAAQVLIDILDQDMRDDSDDMPRRPDHADEFGRTTARSN